jgi:DNA-binding MarR family transcriptional regulator
MQCYCAAARRAARRLTRMYEAALEPAGMNPAQFELLSYLQARPGMSQSVYAEALDIDQTTLSRNLRGLVQRGWVEASAGAQDRRLAVYRLSPAGGLALREAMPLWHRAMEMVEARLQEKDAVWRVVGELSGAAGVGASHP